MKINEAIYTKREKAHDPGPRAAGRADDASARAVRQSFELRAVPGPYETTAGSVDLAGSSALSSSPMAMPRRLET